MAKQKPEAQLQVRACGTGILVELLKADEVLQTSLYLPKASKLPALQGVVLDIGPALNVPEWGVAVGARVVLEMGSPATPVPKPKSDDDNGRDWIVVQPHTVKAVLSY